MSYAPQALALTLSRQCNLTCGHCIVEAEPRERERLSPALIDQVLNQARSVGIVSVLIYGGEPFLRIRDLLPETLHKVLEKGFPISIGTNGFWGRTETQAMSVLSDLEKITAQYNGFISLGISVDKYHQPRISPESIVNIITQHRIGNFPHIRLGIQSFKENESWNALDEVVESCGRKGIDLIETNDFRYLYPALREDFIEFKQENFPLIVKNLKLPLNTDKKIILSWIANLFDLMKKIPNIVIPTVIAWNIDIGEGKVNYLIFPDPNYLIDYVSEKKVINAGRARKGGNLEMDLQNNKGIDLLVIAPNGQAYAYPAQITAEEGVFVGNKSLEDVILEVGRRITK